MLLLQALKEVNLQKPSPKPVRVLKALGITFPKSGSCFFSSEIAGTVVPGNKHLPAP